MENSPVAPTHKHHIGRIHSPIIRLMHEIVRHRMQPTHELTGNQYHCNPQVQVLGPHCQNRSKKKKKQHRIEEKF